MSFSSLCGNLCTGDTHTYSLTHSNSTHTTHSYSHSHICSNTHSLTHVFMHTLNTFTHILTGTQRKFKHKMVVCSFQLSLEAENNDYRYISK